MFLKAVKFLKDTNSFKEGDILTFQPGLNVICGPADVGKTELMRFIVEAFMNGCSDTIACFQDKDNNENETDISNGVIYVSCDGKVTGSCDPCIMQEAQNISARGDKAALFQYIRDNVNKSLIIFDEFLSSLTYDQKHGLTDMSNSHYSSKTNQLFLVSANDTRYSSLLSVGNRIWVDDRYYRCARTLEKLTIKLYQPGDNGYLVKIDTSGLGQTRHNYRYPSYIPDSMWLCGKGEAVTDITGAFIYKTAVTAEKAIEAAISNSFGIPFRGYYGGALFYSTTLKNLDRKRFSVITKKEYNEMLLGLKK